MDLHVRQWPPDLKRQLKARAAVEGRTLREVLIEAAEKWLQNATKRRARKKP